MKTRIGELLVKNKIITDKQLTEALSIQKKENKKLGEILIELGYIGANELIWMLSEQADIPFVELKPEMLDRTLINSFPENILYDNLILPLYETEDKIYIALGDPANPTTIEHIKKFTTKEIVISGADPKKIETLLNKFYLAQQLEKPVIKKTKGIITVEINAEHGIVKITDNGKTTEMQGALRLNIKINKNKE